MCKLRADQRSGARSIAALSAGKANSLHHHLDDDAWTLPASLAVAFIPSSNTLRSRTPTANVYIVAEALAAAAKEKCNLHRRARDRPLPRSRSWSAPPSQHPFLDRSILGVLADYVTTEQGTGAVHTAPSHGADDFYTGANYEPRPESQCR